MKKIYLTAICALFVCASAHAADVLTPAGRSSFPKPQKVEERSQLKPHIGLLAGAAIPEGGGGTSAELGLDIGYQPYVPFGLGAEYVHTRFDNGVATADRNTLWVKGTYNFGGDIEVFKNSYIGLAVGAVFDDSETAIAGAPIVGFDIPMTIAQNNDVSLGANAKYAIVGDGRVDALSINGVIKYWY
ncbi:MAG: hypothetical protein H7328_00565 [Bdellovibrio sp.]|nr:hypothetical protein [Bdellovibrio sp.]